MQTHADKKTGEKNRTDTAGRSSSLASGRSAFSLEDNRPKIIAQRKQVSASATSNSTGHNARRSSLTPPGTGKVVQGFFIKDGKMPDYEEILNDSREILLSLGIPKDQMEFVLKKLIEGPDIRYKNSDELREMLKGILAQHKDQLLAPKEKGGWRKLNRLAGLMNSKVIMLGGPPQLHSVVWDFRDIVAIVNRMVTANEFKLATLILDRVINLMNKGLKPYLQTNGSRYVWHIYDLLSNFGPLAYTLASMFPDDKEIATRGLLIRTDLRLIRQLMAKNPKGVTVIAHRGHGPTNRTMGRLIRDEDNRRLHRPAENSPEAFDAALKSVGPSGLDGIECDVFLSSDGVPMLSHEGNVMEQLDAEQKKIQKGIDAHTEVHQVTAGELQKIQRTKSPHSRFMTLVELLQMAIPVADHYYRSTGKAFRVEIEMKGAKVKADKKNLNIGPQQIRTNVARVVSRFHKMIPLIPVEIILFNGEMEDLKGYSGLRSSKTALGGIYTGLNTKPEETETGPSIKEYIDELRYQFTAEIADDHSIPFKYAKEYLDDFIATLVFGQETEPTEKPTKMEPSHALIDFGKDKGSRPFEIDKAKKIDESIYKALGIFVSDPKNIEKLKKMHILTDYPQKAAWLKQRLIKASTISLEKTTGSKEEADPGKKEEFKKKEEEDKK